MHDTLYAVYKNLQFHFLGDFLPHSIHSWSIDLKKNSYHLSAEGHQWVFNVARNSRTRSRPSAGPLKKVYTSTVIMDVILNSELYTRN